MEERIRKAVADYLTAQGAEHVSFVVERPVEMSHGDYTTNAALAAAKVLGKSPRELGDILAAYLMETLGEGSVSRVSVAGPGFINIVLAREAVTLAITEADAQGSEWGRGVTNEGKKVSIEYSNPNPFKEIHIGHLMSNVIGEATSRLIEASGAAVIRDTFGGDVGPHVAKALWALRKEGVVHIESAKQIGEAYARGSTAYEEGGQAKQEVDDLNTKIYDLVDSEETVPASEEDRTLLALWREGREVSMAEFRRIFALLGTKFDYEFFDSDTTETGKRVVTDGLDKGIFEKSDGAVIYRGEKKGFHTLVFITSRGTPTYETKDIGLAFLKEEKIASDEVIIVTGAEQKGHFQVFLAALGEIAPLVAEKMKHVAHGLLSLSSGKMSSRLGNVITATGLIEDITKKATDKNDDPLIAEQVAIGAIKYMILRQSPGSDIIFDAEKSLSLEGDSGPYLQYALVRAKSVITQSNVVNQKSESPEEVYSLERVILHYPEVAARAAREYAPNLLVTYLTELASAWNSFYAQERIIGGDYEAYKLMLARAFVATMTNGLTLLGIPTPERM
jgi:arginyl-tRNA synthetase